MKALIGIDQFKILDMRVGTVVEAEPAKGVKVPALWLKIDFGPLGIKSSSAQITDHYTPEDLVGRQVVGIVNFPPRQIGKFSSEVLVLGGYEQGGAVRLLKLDQPVENGARLK